MRKGVGIISAGITAFVMTITASALYGYKSLSSASEHAIPTASPESMSLKVADVAPADSPSVAAQVAPQDAASIAAKYLNRTDLYSVELADYQGAQTYKVTFGSGDVVYVTLNGQVVGATPPPTPVTVTSGGGGGGHRGGHHESGGEGGSEPEHESGGDG